MENAIYLYGAIQTTQGDSYNSLLTIYRQYLSRRPKSSLSCVVTFNGTAFLLSCCLNLYRRENYQNSNQKKVLEHSGVSQKQREQCRNLTTLDLEVGRTIDTDCQRSTVQYKRMLRKMDKQIRRMVKRLILINPYPQGI